MTHRTAEAIRRLCQAQYAWRPGDSLEWNHTMAEDLPTSPILGLSSGLATALWGDRWPVGVDIEQDDRLWLFPTVAHMCHLRTVPFKVRKDVLMDLAKSPDHMSIGLWVAAHAQAATQGWPIGRRIWENLVTRVTTCPESRVRQRVEAAIQHLDAACTAAGYPDAITWHWQKQEPSKARSFTPHEPGRPKDRWGIRVFPAGRPFIRGEGA